ncbi:PCNA-associated factor-like [Asterias rubens]|uniref:PCNA-associated factor-like n=1 Tax=Asterias rubens TaxID=7604 RepID=UPI0014557583|nr:PCNA-associated factor-like [Asterias rubens]
MVRTKADNCSRKAVAAKAPRKNLGASSSGVMMGSNSMKSPAGKKSKYAGGNSVCPRPTPEWQKEITNFLIKSPRSASKQKENEDPDNEEEDETAGCSREERIKDAAGSSSSSRVEEDIEEEKEDEEEEVKVGSSSSSSSRQKFVKNKCISDSEDDY